METPEERPEMVAMAGRPIKVLRKPQADILIACRTAQGEDVHVPISALTELFASQLAGILRTQGGQTHGHD